MQLYGDVRYLKGIGEARAKLLEKLDIRTVYDLISYFPRAYEDRSIIRELSGIGDGETCCVRALVVSTPLLSRIRKGLNLTRFRIADDRGLLLLDNLLVTLLGRHLDSVFLRSTENKQTK